MKYLTIIEFMGWLLVAIGMGGTFICIDVQLDRIEDNTEQILINQDSMMYKEPLSPSLKMYQFRNNLKEE